MSEQILQICLSTFKPLQNGHTPLHHASWYGHVAVIEVLLKNGAEINQTNNVSWHIISFSYIDNIY